MNKNGRVFSDNQTGQVCHAIRQLRERCLMHLRHGITAEDLFEAFVKEKDKAPIRHVMETCQVDVRHQQLTYHTDVFMDVNDVHLIGHMQYNIQLSTESKYKFLFPKYMGQGAALFNASEKFADTMRLLASIHFEWAQMWQIFQYLNEKCERPAQVISVCPALAVALAEVPDTHVMGERLKGMKPSFALPAFHPGLRDLADKMKRTVGKALVLPKECDKEDDEVGVSVAHATSSEKRWDGEVWDIKVPY